MKVSVIIPVWNTGKAACRLIGELLPQYEGMEIIAVDDGSSDDSLALLRAMARKDKRVRVIHQENAGASAARNAGIDISQGEYLMFLDSDDEVADGYVSKMVKAIAGAPRATLAVCGRRYHRVLEGTDRIMNVEPCRRRRNREKMADYVLHLLCFGERIYSSIDKIYRAEIVRKAGVRFEVGKAFAEDTKFVLDYLRVCWSEKKYSSGDIICVNEPLYIYNYGTETSTVRKSALVWENWEQQMKDTTDFVEKTSGVGLRTVCLLILLGVRWRISWRRARRRAKKAEKAKSEKTVGKFLVVGVTVTLFDFLCCTALTRWIFRTNDLQWLAAGMATFAATFLAYFLHSRITWKNRQPGKAGIIKFFIWNMLAAVAIKPATTWLFGLFAGLYQLAFGIVEWLHLPLSYDTVEYLGVYALATIVVMTLNFFFYDRLVFGKKD